MSQNPNQPADVFVTDADLSARRDPPKTQSVIDFLVRNRYGRALLLAVYLVFLYFAWTTVADIGQVDATISETAIVEETPEAEATAVVTDEASDATSADTDDASDDEPGENILMTNQVIALLFAVVGVAPFFITILVQSIMKQQQTGIPVVRNEDFLAGVAQTVFLAIVLWLAFFLIANLQNNLAQSNVRINFNVLVRDFGVNVSEGPADPGGDWDFFNNIPVIGDNIYNSDYLQPNTVTRALLAGLVNTLRVVSISLVFATMLGILLGIGLLMNNWLLQKVSTAFVEVFRNTPLLLQLFFIYRAVLGALPSRPTEAVALPGNIFISGRGIAYPAFVPTETANFFIVCLSLGIAVGIGLWRWRLQVNEQTGVPANTLQYFLGATITGIVVGLGLSYAFGGAPYTIDPPVAGNFNFEGGSTFSAEYLALALGLILYTSAFIADIVRAGIQSVPKGQLEASSALGLTGGQTLRMIVLPQALRLIIPPLTNQYLNLSKNSSLAIAIGFFDLYNVANVAQNQTGQAVALFVVLMISYLILSLIISLFMNIFNQSQALKTR